MTDQTGQCKINRPLFFFFFSNVLPNYFKKNSIRYNINSGIEWSGQTDDGILFMNGCLATLKFLPTPSRHITTRVLLAIFLEKNPSFDSSPWFKININTTGKCESSWHVINFSCNWGIANVSLLQTCFNLVTAPEWKKSSLVLHRSNESPGSCSGSRCSHSGSMWW